MRSSSRSASSGFGVGAGGVGIGDVFRESAGPSGVPSISDSEKRVSENPRDAAAFRDLATAHQAAGNTDDAIEALESFVALKPKNAAALVDLASLYLVKVDESQRRANVANIRAAYLAPGAAVASFTQFGGRPLDPDPISGAVDGQLSQIVQTELGQAQTAAAQAVDAYKRRAAIEPRNALFQLELAQTAESAGDPATAITRLREVPRARAGRSERARRPGAAEAAPGPDRRHRFSRLRP